MIEISGKSARWAKLPAVRFFYFGSFILFLSACGGSGQGGLSNVPSPSRIDIETTERHDVIANGPESCPAVEGDADPLPNRRPGCPEAPKKAAKVPEFRRD